MAEFREDIAREFAELRTADQREISTFIQRQEAWIARGDEILDLCDHLSDGEFFMRLSGEAAGQFWKEMTTTTFQILYAIAAMEARLDVLTSL